MSRISFRNVQKRYGDQVAVEGFTLDIGQGELVALLGPSGCGKTTTLRMVAGFVEATAGQILFDDRDVTGLPPYRRNTGMVFQSYALFPHLTVAENVAYGLRRRGVAKPEIEARVARALDRVRLRPLSDRLPRQMSGGQQQRVALARALVIEPDALLLDEPLSNLDAKLRDEMRTEIRQIQQSLGVTTIFVTHDQEEALSVADRLVVMNAGRIEQVGTPLELYEAPRTEFVASFIGGANLFHGRLDGERFVLTSGHPLVFARGPEPDGTGAALAVRPERMTLAAPDAPARAGENALPGAVQLRTYLGATTEYLVALDGNGTVRLRRNEPADAVAAAPKPGERVSVRWPASASILL
jgi:putative spermidine/putrescine transport system ATP-binding protein